MAESRSAVIENRMVNLSDIQAAAERIRGVYLSFAMRPLRDIFRADR